MGGYNACVWLRARRWVWCFLTAGGCMGHLCWLAVSPAAPSTPSLTAVLGAHLSGLREAERLRSLLGSPTDSN